MVPARLGLSRLPLRRPRLRPSGGDVWLFTGCVMDAWMRDVHAATQRVIEATGATVAIPGAGAACCGALHIHAGARDDGMGPVHRTHADLGDEGPGEAAQLGRAQ